MVGDSKLGAHRTRPRHHAVIAGTGRAGTTFLVRFLGDCGLDVGSASDHYDDRAKAGLEHSLLDDQAPYVVKDPWLFTYCNYIDLDAVKIDALLIPVRDLIAAATSRILQERIAMAEGPQATWPPSDVTGTVTAGAIYSLNPIDEARILAVGFHQLVHWAIVNQLPLYLLEFPRTVNDGQYLVDTLWPWLRSQCDREQALRSFAAVADPQLVRIDGTTEAVSHRDESLDADALDRDAMAILLKERDARLALSADQLAEAREVLYSKDHQVALLREALAESHSRLRVVEAQLLDAEGQNLRHLDALNEMQGRLNEVVAEMHALRRTLSWRVTRPLRKIRAVSRG